MKITRLGLAMLFAPALPSLPLLDGVIAVEWKQLPAPPIGHYFMNWGVSSTNHSFSMELDLTEHVSRFAYSPVVFSGFDGTCAPIPGSGPCSWNTSQNYVFEYWSPGRFGEPAPVILGIQTPQGVINYNGRTNPSGGGYFYFRIRLNFAGGPATLPGVSGTGEVSRVEDLPVTYTLDMRVLRPDAAQGPSPPDRWWISGGECLWCASYSGIASVDGESGALPFTLGKRYYVFEETPEPTTFASGLLGLLGILWWRSRTRTNRIRVP